MRGTYAAYNALTHKDSDTLYFVYEKDAKDGDLYLGEKLIADGRYGELTGTSLAGLSDVALKDLVDKQTLIYDEASQKWINKSIDEAISVFIGASDQAAGIPGLVPGPEMGQTNLFLRSDGQWAAIENGPTNETTTQIYLVEKIAGILDIDSINQALVGVTLNEGDIAIVQEVLVLDKANRRTPYIRKNNEWIVLVGETKADKVYFTEDLGQLEANGLNLQEVIELLITQLNTTTDNLSIQYNDAGSLSLKNYGTQYYAFNSENGEYTLQSGWKAGLEPRVTLEDSQLVLGWYEPNTNTLDGINDQVTSLTTTVQSLADTIGAPATGETAASGLYAELEEKANIADVYTTTQVDKKIGEAVAAADHLKRKKVNEYEDIQKYIDTHEDADQYIFMVPVGFSDTDNKYKEYIVIEGNIEPVGTWEVNLDNYVTNIEFTTTVGNLETSINSKVDKVQGSRLITQEEADKLAGLTPCIIKSINAAEFEITEVGQLNIKTIPQSKIEGLTAINSTIDILNKDINGYVDDKGNQVNGLKAIVASNTEALSALNAIIGDTTELETNDSNIIKEIEELKEALTWKDISELI